MIQVPPEEIIYIFLLRFIAFATSNFTKKFKQTLFICKNKIGLCSSTVAISQKRLLMKNLQFHLFILPIQMHWRTSNPIDEGSAPVHHIAVL